MLLCGQGNILSTAYCGGKFRAERGVGETQIICGLETYMWPDSSRRAMHKRTAVSRFTAPRGQGNALSTACSGGEFRAVGGVKKGGSRIICGL